MRILNLTWVRHACAQPYVCTNVCVLCARALQDCKECCVHNAIPALHACNSVRLLYTFISIKCVCCYVFTINVHTRVLHSEH